MIFSNIGSSKRYRNVKIENNCRAHSIIFISINLLINLISTFFPLPSDFLNQKSHSKFLFEFVSLSTFTFICRVQNSPFPIVSFRFISSISDWLMSVKLSLSTESSIKTKIIENSKKAQISISFNKFISFSTLICNFCSKTHKNEESLINQLLIIYAINSSYNSGTRNILLLSKSQCSLYKWFNFYLLCTTSFLFLF